MSRHMQSRIGYIHQPADDNMSQSSVMSEGEIQALEEDSVPESTAKATKYGLGRFEAWLERRNLSCDFHTISSTELNNILRRFYAEVKSKRQGASLAPSTLTGLRAALHRYGDFGFDLPFGIFYPVF